jgi:ribosomal protein S27AE
MGLPMGPYSSFESPEGEIVYVLRACPKCGRFIKDGQVLVNGLGGVELKGWICGRCGEVKPYFEYL